MSRVWKFEFRFAGKYRYQSLWCTITHYIVTETKIKFHIQEFIIEGINNKFYKLLGVIEKQKINNFSRETSGLNCISSELQALEKVQMKYFVLLFEEW